MKKVEQSIMTMQCDLNKMLEHKDIHQVETTELYTLSVLLDKEIVKYYRNTLNAS